MSYKTILVALNDLTRTRELMQVATTLASRSEAHLIGLYVIPAVRIYPAMSAHVTPAVIDAFKLYFEEHSGETRKAFEDAASRAGIAAEWREVEITSPNIATGIIDHGYQADLIIASQYNEETNSGIESDCCERVVMESGRPVLLIPTAGTIHSIGENVLVGWNATREAARAVFDALPILKSAEATRLVWIDPQDEPRKSGNLPGAEMAATLARHGVRATAEAMPTDSIGEGNALLNRASELGADLIVMGAYGHSRMREFVFGGATRTILQTMTVPVLLSH